MIKRTKIFGKRFLSLISQFLISLLFLGQSLDLGSVVFTLFEKFYFMIGKFIYEMGLKFIQAIASLIEAILPF